MFDKYPKTRISKLYFGEGIIRFTIEHKDHWYSKWHFMMDGKYPRLFSKDELELLGYRQNIDSDYINKLAVNYRQELEDLGYDFSDDEKELIEATYINGYKEALEYLSNKK